MLTAFPRTKATHPRINYVWLLDRAPAHIAHKIQKICQKNLAYFASKKKPPPPTPDLEPLDFFFLGAVEKEVNASLTLGVEALRAKISSKGTSYPTAGAVKARDSFRYRIESVVKVSGGRRVSKSND